MNTRSLLALLAALVLGLVLGSAVTSGKEGRAPLDAAATPHEPAEPGLDVTTLERLVSVLEALEKRLATELPKQTLAPSGAPAQRIDLDAQDEPSNDEMVTLLQSIDGRLSRLGGSSSAFKGRAFGAESAESREDWLTLQSSRAPINTGALERFLDEHASEGGLVFGPDLYFYELRDFIRDFGWPSEIQRWDVTDDKWELRYEGLSIPYAYAESPIIELTFEFRNGQLNRFDYDVE